MENAHDPEQDNALDEALEQIIKKTEAMEKRIEEILSKTRKRAVQDTR